MTTTFVTENEFLNLRQPSVGEKCCCRKDLQLKMQVLERYAAIMQLKGRFLAVLVIAERIYIHLE